MGIPEKKVLSATAAVAHIRNGNRVFISSGAAEPRCLLDALAERYRSFADVEMIHLVAAGRPHFVETRFRDHFRYNSFEPGDVVAPALRDCAVDYTPLHLSELPRLLETGRYPLDVALISVTPPDEQGNVCLGPSVDVTHEAIRGARTVIAQVNDRLPRTGGATRIPMNVIDGFVLHDEAPAEVVMPPGPGAAATVGGYAAELVECGDVLHISYDPLAYAVFPHLAGKRDLGIHTDIFSDAHVELLESGAATNRTKGFAHGRSVATMVMGTQRAYDYAARDPAVALLPTAVVGDRRNIASHRRMIAIRSAMRADVTGNALLDALGSARFRGVGAEMEFLRGASSSERGFPVIVITSTDPATGNSNIVTRIEETDGTLVNRASIHYVCTEYGFAHLHAKTLRERVLAMIAIAHPQHRERLMAEAKERGYVPKDQMVTPYPGCLYPNELVSWKTFGDDLKIFFRPIHPSDERGIQRFFYSHTPETIRYRYHGAIKTMPHAKVQQLTNIDYRKDVALVGMHGSRGNRRVACVGRYMFYGEDGGCGEVDLTIGEDYHGRGIGTYLVEYLTAIARERGLRSLRAEILHDNRGAVRLFDKVWKGASRHLEDGVYTYVLPLRDDPNGCSCRG